MRNYVDAFIINIVCKRKSNIKAADYYGTLKFQILGKSQFYEQG